MIEFWIFGHGRLEDRSAVDPGVLVGALLVEGRTSAAAVWRALWFWLAVGRGGNGKAQCFVRCLVVSLVQLGNGVVVDLDGHGRGRHDGCWMMWVI